jgi:hypothetical protein
VFEASALLEEPLVRLEELEMAQELGRSKDIEKFERGKREGPWAHHEWLKTAVSLREAFQRR